MSGEIEALGDIVTGGLIARAVDGDDRAGSNGSAGNSVKRCLNCGAFRTAPFCGQCGQPGHIHRSITAFWHDLLHGVLHFEGKLWRTIPMLFTRPGELTRRYINGERVRYFSPLALFLFSVFVTFAVYGIAGLGFNAGYDGMTSDVEIQSNINGAQNEIARGVADLQQQLAAQRQSGNVAEVARLEREVAETRNAAEVLGFGSRASAAAVRGNHFIFTDIDTGVPQIDAIIERMNANPSLMLYKLQGNTYKWAWALIPLSAPFLWLMYPFSRRFGMYDHLVFVTYSISFMLLLLMLSRLFAVLFERLDWGTGGAALLLVMFFYPPVHVYWQLRGTYRSSRIGALLRAFVLMNVALVILLVFFVLLLAIGAAA